MGATLLEQFMTEECTPYVRSLLQAGIEAARAGTAPQRKSFEFNRFEVTLDVKGAVVVLADVLDPNESGVQRLALGEFFAVLEKSA